MNHKSGPHRPAEAHIREIDDTAAKQRKRNKSQPCCDTSTEGNQESACASKAEVELRRCGVIE